MFFHKMKLKLKMNVCGIQHQQYTEAANQILRKQELERNQLIQQLNQLDTENQDDNITLEKTRRIPFTFKTGNRFSIG